ncbi:putative sugar O-methyltransferase [Actinomadura graeca]|uniref:Sugar O-methyltransferase n=1 Tax=Actinomadura graeca TaxID=2750812 RepID=A0ABX8R508_9ACTN|nr:putative sugar O-methyltransferase [Actinomadura graeca]QXJ26144.1 putative sugar O-methyltransferase [Actinomadura graeca]
MVRNLQASPQWEHIQESWVTEDAAADLTSFKSDDRNFNISLWNPHANGPRYFKTLVHELATRLEPADWARLRKVENRDVGEPLSVRLDGESVCLDYLQAVLELGFIERQVDLGGARVMEIGAGYGRTCHTVLANHDVAEYWIVDLTNTLRLSTAYLREVLDPERYARVRFVDVEDIDEVVRAPRFDLCVNIHSFTEMTPETVREYLDLIDEKCAAFYVKNPVGKFLDKRLDGHFKGDEAVQMALRTGPLRKVLDIFDTEAVEAAVPDFVGAYRPGDDWVCAADARGVPWSYFWQALYKNGRT